MALHYFSDYKTKHGTLNFGDNINPALCKYFFNENILKSRHIVLIGIGTILNDANVARINHYKNKIVFSSGAGYGDFTLVPDQSWDFVCVRGPMTASKLNLQKEKGICDGAILLSEMFPSKKKKSTGILFIPHINTIWSSKESLEKICSSLNIKLLSPSEPAEVLVDAVKNAELVITEAMHGAILSDAMRTPWIPIDMRGVEQFKWQDWFKSMEIEESLKSVKPMLWDNQLIKNNYSLLNNIKSSVKIQIVKQQIKEILSKQKPILSSD